MSDPSEIRNWRRLDHRITTSGQPTEEQLGKIQKLGVSFLVNLGLHTHEEALPDEAASAAALGMKYVHIPVEFDRPCEECFERFCATMSEIGEATVHIHCILNARVSAFVYLYQTEALGLPGSIARALMDTIWRPGGVWAWFINDATAIDRPHQWAGQHY